MQKEDCISISSFFSYVVNIYHSSRTLQKLTPKNIPIFSVQMDNSADDNVPVCFSGEESLLMHSIYDSNFEIAKLLVEQGQNVNYKCKHGMNALLVAIQMNDEKCVEMLVKNKAQVDEILSVTVDTLTEMDMTALILACQLNSAFIAELLINAGANVDKRIPNGINALMVATDNNSTDCVRLLLAHGASANSEKGSQSPLMLAAINSNIDCMRMLLKHGSNPNTQEKNGNTALMMSARAKDVQCLQLLIDRGADLNLKDDDQFHALMIAQCCENNNACTSLLIRAGSSLNTVNAYNETPLNYAIDSDNEVIFDHLIKFGVDVNQLTGDGCTPLWCVINSYEQIAAPESYIKTLLRNGANPNIGRYPAHTLAARSSYMECLQLLLKAGANIDTVDPQFGTILSIAGYMGSITMIRIAWNYHAKINISPKEPDVYPLIPDDEALITLFATGQNWSFFESGNSDIPSYLTESRKEKTLKNLSREAIRKYILNNGRHIDLFREIPLLQLPQLINSYLLYEMRM